MTKPICKLTGIDNIFAIMANVKHTLIKAGQRDKSNEFQEAAFNSVSHDAILDLVHKYVILE